MNRDEYNALSKIIFSGKYPGYTPDIVEAPDYDLNNADEHKRYAHIAPKYFDKYDGPGKDLLIRTYSQAFNEAVAAAKLLNIPEEYMPTYEASNMRLLYYPANTGGAAHTDFCLFTLMTYRDQKDKFKCRGPEIPEHVLKDFPQIHYGDLMREIGRKNPHPHQVLPSETAQHSVVFFAVPAHDAPLASGLTVGEFLEERIKRSRKPSIKRVGEEFKI